jgi:hypothetical protein
MFETILAIITIYARNLVSRFPLEISSSVVLLAAVIGTPTPCRNRMDIQHLQLVEDFRRAGSSLRWL